MRDPEFHEFDRDGRGGGAASAWTPAKPDLWQRLTRAMELFLYLLVLAALLRLFWPEVEKQRALNAELARAEEARAAREARAGELRQEHELLKSDRDYLETIARDRLDKSRPGEYIIRIERPGEPSDTLPPPPRQVRALDIQP